MTCHYLSLVCLWMQTYFRLLLLSTAGYPDLGIASDWSCHMVNLLQAIRCTTQIWLVMHHQCGISVLVSQMSFGGKPVVEVISCTIFSLFYEQSEGCLEEELYTGLPRSLAKKIPDTMSFWKLCIVLSFKLTYYTVNSTV